MAPSLTVESPRPITKTSAAVRIISIDALRGLVMFAMIFVNDLAGAPARLVPGWMRHYEGRSGMTFVDLVFPAFLFIVGLSVPFAIGSRLAKGEAVWRVMGHVATRTLALLMMGILMVNGSPDPERLGWPAELWTVLMFVAAMLAFCAISPAVGRGPADGRNWKAISLGLRAVGFAGLAYLAWVFRGRGGERIVTFSPLHINTEWYGILGLIGWAYLVACVVFLLCRDNRTALLGAVVLLLCLYPADRSGLFEGFPLASYVNIGGAFGSQGAIAVAGVLLASVLRTPETSTVWARTRFTLLMAGGFSVAALLLNGLYGINKNAATPAWALWACVVTALLWLVLYWMADAGPMEKAARPLAIAGQNVLLAYLLSEMLPSLLNLIGIDGWYARLAEPNLACAVARSTGCAVIVLTVTALLNRAGLRLRL